MTERMMRDLDIEEDFQNKIKDTISQKNQSYVK